MIYKGCGYKKTLMKNREIKQKWRNFGIKFLENNQKFTKLYKEKWLYLKIVLNKILLKDNKLLNKKFQWILIIYKIH